MIRLSQLRRSGSLARTQTSPTRTPSPARIQTRLRRTAAWLLLLLILVTQLFEGAAITAQANTPAPVKTLVRVGYVESSNFMEGMSDDAEKSGLGYDYLQKVSYYTNWEYEYVYGDWDTILNMLYNGEVDVMAGLSRTDERENKVLYPDYPMGTENYYIYVYADSLLAGMGIAGLENHTVSVNKGSIMEEMLRQWNEDGRHNMTIQTYAGNDARYADFDARVTDATVDTDNAILPEDQMIPMARIGSSSYYLAVTKDRSDLLWDLNNALGKIASTDPNFTKRLADQYFNDIAVSAQMQDDEKRWIKENSTIRVGYLDNYMPFSGTDEEGNPTGIVTDVTKEILAQLGLTQQTRLVFRPYESAENLLDALQAENVDVIFPVMNNVAAAEKNGIFLTSEVMDTAMSLVFKGDYTEESTKKIAVKAGNEIQDRYTREHYPDAEIVYYNSEEDSLAAVQAGKVGSVIINEFRKDGYLNHTQYRSLNSVTLPNYSSRCFAVKSGNNELLSILNRGITNLPRSFATRATYSYTGRLAEVTFQDFLEENMAFVLCVLAAFVAIISAVALNFIHGKKHREVLDRMAHKDSMTGLLNRRAYDEFMDRFGQNTAEPNLMILAMDLNGLKVTNDTLGHEAGDELIEGAAKCMKDVLSPHGKVYRIGGDEFVAILDVEYAYHDRIISLLRRSFADWKGNRVASLSVAVGVCLSDEEPDITVFQMGTLADKRLYEEKEEYYKVTGRDRRRR